MLGLRISNDVEQFFNIMTKNNNDNEQATYNNLFHYLKILFLIKLSDGNKNTIVDYLVKY